MSFSVAVAGTSVQIITAGGVISTVTLPDGVTVVSGKPARFAILGRYVICVNATTEPIVITPEGTAYRLRIEPPTSAPTVAAGAAGTLSGTFTAQVQFVIKDGDGRDLAVSAPGPVSEEVIVANQLIAYSAIPISGDGAVNCRRISRTATGPTESFFENFDIDDNTTTTWSNGDSDLELALLPVDEDFGPAPPGLRIITEFKGRLWGASDEEPDTIRFTTEGNPFAWPVEFSIPVQPVGQDTRGVIGFVAKRDELGISKRYVFWKLTGSNEDDFRLIKLVENKGGQQIMVSPDTVVVTRDVARWLGSDTVYEWNADSVSTISDEDVRPWFTADAYFDRAEFPSAFARYEPIRHAYELFLQWTDGSGVAWVSFDITRRKWLGPHFTTLAAPTSAGVVLDDDELLVAALGFADGYMRVVTPGSYADDSQSIFFEIATAFMTRGTPNVEKLWKRLSILCKIQTGTLSITAALGELNALHVSRGTRDMSVPREHRQKLIMIGRGKLCAINLSNDIVNQGTEIYGFEIPVHELGER